MEVYFSSLAVSDLEEVRDYLAARDADAAIRLLDEVDTACSRLKEFPNLGVARDDVLIGLRMFPVLKNYIVFYRVVDPFVEIVRVVHSARDFDRLFTTED